MKKIMFNDKYGLTEAVLEGRKTMTRRIVPPGVVSLCERGMLFMAIGNAKYKPGEVVAVAQSYKDAGLDQKNCDKFQLIIYGDFPSKHNHGWTNKMYVRADLMPHQICITNVRVERLQDISDEDCFREGVYKKTLCPPGDIDYYYHSEPRCKWGVYPSARAAFAGLIDKVSGKGTWGRNPWVFVYELELVK